MIFPIYITSDKNIQYKYFYIYVKYYMKNTEKNECNNKFTSSMCAPKQ